MEKKDQETLLQTIRARLNRMDDGSIQWLPDPQGPWKIVPFEPKANGIYEYFKPAINIGFDEYGQENKNQ